MEAIWIALVAFLVFIGIALVAGGVLFTFFRLRAREPVHIPMRLLLRLYLFTVIIVGALLLTQGMSELLKAGFAAAVDKDFSYSPVFVRLPGDDEFNRPHPLEFKDSSLLAPVEREELATWRAEREQRRQELETVRRDRGLDRAQEEGLIEGISFALIGAAVWAAHVAGRRWLETSQEREEPLNRIYLILVTIIFGVITIVSLPQAVFDTLRYALLDPLTDFGREFQPGGKLALSIAALPIWIAYLVGAIRAVRHST